jgi:hypothetical protein
VTIRRKRRATRACYCTGCGDGLERDAEMVWDALSMAARLDTPWRQLVYACFGLIAPFALLLYAIGWLYVGVTACGIGLVIGLIATPIWLVRLLGRAMGRRPAPPQPLRHPVRREMRAAIS